MALPPQKLIDIAQDVINIELEAIRQLHARIDDTFVQACDTLLACTGRIIVMGMGKSGHIGNKLAATLASTGSPAFFVHAAEASHGDLGMLTKEDVLLLISNSGETPELLALLPLIQRLAIPMIALTGHAHSTIATHATAHLNVGVEQEACPLGLAPTSSTTTALVMGDALALALLAANGFTAEDFAFTHPGGSLGRRLILQVRDIMHTGDHIPTVPATALVSDALIEMTEKSLGMTIVLDNHAMVIGLFTDGDLRRIVGHNINIHDTPISQVMTTTYRTTSPEQLASVVLTTMQHHRINAMPIIDNDNTLVGAINMHDLLRAGLI